MAPSTRQVDNDHQEVVFYNDPDVDLKAIIAIHSTVLGPSLGGVRMWPYASEEDALEDVLRLSRGMTYKSAIAGLALGGGKAVIIADPKKDKSSELFESFGRFVDSFNGRYIAAEDVGTSVEDLEIIARQTDYAAGLPSRGGDPSPVTAYGVFRGIEAAVKHRFGAPSVAGLTIAVQGLGHVGRLLCEHLAEAGAQLVVADIDDDLMNEVVARHGALASDPTSIHQADVDVFAPCALGAVLNDQTIPQLRARVVAGAANNQLAEDRHGDALRERGILYAPDYVINGGGIINISYEFGGYDRERALAHTARIYDTLLDIFSRADDDRVATNLVADRMAEERLVPAGRVEGPKPPAHRQPHTQFTVNQTSRSTASDHMRV